MATSRGRGRLVVLVAAALAQFSTGSISYAVGVFHVALLQTFHQDVVTVAWLGALFSSMCLVTGFVSSALINTFDCRTCTILGGLLTLAGFAISSVVTDIRFLFLTYGVTAGTGQGMVFTACTVIMGYHFPDKPGLATGMGLVGQAMGMFVYPPVVQLLVDSFGLRGTLLVVGALTSHALPLGLLLVPTPLERRRRRLLFSGRSFREALAKTICGDCGKSMEIFKVPALWFHVLSAFCFGVSCGIFYLFLPDYYADRGTTLQVASLGVSLNGVGSVTARLLVAPILDEPSISRGALYLGCNGLAGILILLVQQLAASTTGQLLLSMAIGAYTGVVWLMLAPLTLSMVRLEQYASSTGATFVATGLGYLAGPPLAGEMFKHTTSYYSVFVVAGLSSLGASACGLMSAMFYKETPLHKEDKEESKEDIGKEVEERQPINACSKDLQPTQQEAQKIADVSCSIENGANNKSESDKPLLAV